MNTQFAWRCVFSAIFICLMLFIYNHCNRSFLLLLSVSPLRAACVIAVLFAVSALGVFPPLSLIYLLCGSVLPFDFSMFLCIAGSALVFSFSYFLGKFKNGTPSVPLKLPNKGGFFTAFALRCVRVAPCKMVGIYMGGAGFPFWSYLLGSIMGSMPSIIVSLIITK